MANRLIGRSEARQPDRQKPPNERIQRAIRLMIDGDGTGVPLNIGMAAAAVGMKRHMLRRFFATAAGVSYLYRQRRAFTASLCAANPSVLASIRDNPKGNQLARVRAVTELEIMDQPTVRSGGADSSPFMTIKIITPPAAPAMTTIEAKPIEAEGDDPNAVTVQRLREPYFRDPIDR